MSKEPIDYRLSKMGANFDEEELFAFLNDPGKKSSERIIRTDHGDYLVAGTSDGMEIWCRLDPENDKLIKDFKVHYKSSTRTKVKFDGWTEIDENGLAGLAYVFNKNKDAGFPLNLDVVNAGMAAGHKAGELTVQIAAFGRNIRLFENEESFEASDHWLTAEGCVPTGAFPVESNKDSWRPSANAVISGRIRHVYECTNAYTGEKYYHLVVRCMGLNLDVPLSKDEADESPKDGGIIIGDFYLTARIFNSMNDECLTPLFSIDTDKIIDEWKTLLLDEKYIEPTHGWELLSYPIMPDKSTVVIFENKSEVDEETPEKSYYFYRFIHIDPEGNILEKRRLRLNGELLNTAYYDADNGFHAVLTPVGKETSYLCDYTEDIDVRPLYSIGEDISRIVTDGAGNVYVAHDYSPYAEYSDELVTVFDKNCNKITYNDGVGYRCSELVLAEDESVLAYTEPFAMLRRITRDKNDIFSVDASSFPLSRVISIAVSADGSRFFCECETGEGMGRFVTVTKKDGKYGNYGEVIPPIRMREYMDTYGMCSTAKDRIIINADGSLFAYKLENYFADRF